MGTRLISRLASGFALSLAVMLAASPLAAASSDSANTLDDELRLNTAITVKTDVITLGDVFDGYLSRPEKVVAQAPKPGQRMTLTADWLADVARTYGLDWQPANGFDRAVVYQPGLTVTTADILDAVKEALVANGMPANYGITAATPIAPVTVAMNASKAADVREAMYNSAGKTFSALVQIPPNDPQAVFIPVRGVAFATVQVPVLKEAAGKNTTISADMIDMVDMPQDQVKPATLIDPNLLVGKTPKFFLKAGQPIRDSDITQVSLVEVPVLITDMDRDGRITKDHIKMASVNAASVPADAVVSPEFLIGKSPRRNLAAGAPIRRADVAVVRQIDVPVAARDLPRGTTVTENDITWVTINEGDITDAVVTDESEIVGQMTRLALRAGQPVRKHSVAKAIAVERGATVTVLWSVKSINLTALGHAMERGAVGDVIRVTNSKSNQTVLAQIVDSRTVRVAAPEQISAR
jgi:flagellar basal body P-ring formation protein FlgA